MAEGQTFISFKNRVDRDLEEQQKFDQLRSQEKELNTEIKKINDDFKAKQDSFAQEAQEASDEIAKQKTRLNETKTERELQVQYKEREIAGKLACMKRLQSMQQQTLRDKISKLKDNLEIEGKVSKKIQAFITAKKKEIETKNDARDKLRETKN